MRKTFFLALVFLIGCSGRPGSPAALKQPDLAHGRLQVERMLRDRPVMRNLVQEDDELYQWAVRQYAGERLGHPIDWNPADGKESIGRFSSQRHRGEICISKFVESKEKAPESQSFDGLWGSFFIQTQYIETRRDRPELMLLAVGAGISRVDFIRRNAQLDFAAAQRAREVVLTVWKPWSEGKLLNPYLVEYYENLPVNFGEWLQRVETTSAYSSEQYGKIWDDINRLR
jgi:hypothetical protein